MFYLSWYGYRPDKKMQLIAPRIKTSKEISIVIPVKDNQRGIDHFFYDFFRTQELQSLPLELLLICDKGASVSVPKECSSYPIEVRVLCSSGIGPASARNVGWQTASGKWILFTDSDCRPTPQWLKGYIEASNGSIGYSGTVLSYGRDFISRYYESQGILMPSINNEARVVSPDYLITANAMVWKKALEKIGGFNEAIKIAAGEDVDLGFRLREIGNLSFVAKSVVFHEFGDGFVGFMKRFRRYGKGNRLLAQMYALNIRPKRFKPRKSSFGNSILAYTQYLSMLWGWYFD
jgi:glycosyltransferase involved in cell wall biosynthesis